MRGQHGRVIGQCVCRRVGVGVNLRLRVLGGGGGRGPALEPVLLGEEVEVLEFAVVDRWLVTFLAGVDGC